MTIVTHRIVTPVFDHDTSGATLPHQGTHGDVEFTVIFRPYTDTSDDFNEVTRYALPGDRDMLRERGMVFSDRKRRGRRASHMLIVDSQYDDGNNEIPPSRFNEIFHIQEAALFSIRLLSSVGVWSEHTFEFLDPPKPGMVSGRPHSLPYPFWRTGSSVLDPSNFKRCIDLIEAMRARFKSANASNLDNILNLARNYHRLALTFEEPQHSFLILMTVFEAMFKRDEKEKFNKAAKRIGCLLGETKTQCGAIRDAFNADADDSFRNIRNQIAHGDVRLSFSSVVARFPSLYSFISRALVYIALPSDIDPAKDYYDEIERITKLRFDMLAEK